MTTLYSHFLLKMYVLESDTKSLYDLSYYLIFLMPKKHFLAVFLLLFFFFLHLYDKQKDDFNH